MVVGCGKDAIIGKKAPRIGDRARPRRQGRFEGEIIVPFQPEVLDMSNAQQRIDELVKSNEVLLFMKGTASFPQCGFSGRAIQILKACGVDPKAVKTVNVLEDDEIRQGIKDYSQWPTIPQLYVKGEFIGGSDIMMEMYESGELAQALGNKPA
jgi:monothiol glutaredoxin